MLVKSLRIFLFLVCADDVFSCKSIYFTAMGNVKV